MLQERRSERRRQLYILDSKKILAMEIRLHDLQETRGREFKEDVEPVL